MLSSYSIGMLIVAHRGGAGEAPENSMEAFRKAITSGCHGIECDVHLTKDGIPVVIHDASIARTTGKEGLVREMLFEDLRNISLIEGGSIPNLEEILDLCEGTIILQIELKSVGTTEKVNELIKSRDNYSNVCVTSFKTEFLSDLRRLNPDVQLGVLAKKADETPWDAIKQLDAHMIGIRFDGIDNDVISKTHSRGMEMYAYHVNDWNEAVRLENMGVDKVGTDYPVSFMKKVEM